MSKKDGMYCYYDWIKPLKRVPAEDFKALFIAMLEFHKDGTVPPDFDGITGMAADFIFPQIERSKTYAQNGAKGGVTTQSKDEALTVGLTNGLTNGSTLKHKHIQKTNTKTNTTPPTPSKGADERFERFWKVYPKHQGKQAAFKAFQKLKLNDELLQTMLTALDAQKRSEQWQRENGKYIPLPATWLNGKRWEDELTAIPFNDESVDDWISSL